MKKIILLLILSFPFVLQAQNVYSYIEEPICWTINGVDSSLTRIYLVSDRTPDQRLLLYTINAAFDTVSVTTDSISFGWCDCCGGGSGDDLSPWKDIDTTNTNSQTAYVFRSGDVSIGVNDNSHNLRLDGDFQFRFPNNTGIFDWRESGSSDWDRTGLLLQDNGEINSFPFTGRNVFGLAANNGSIFDRTILGAILWAGTDPVTGNTLSTSAGIIAQADGNWGVGDLSSQLNFFITKDGESLLSNVFTLQSDGRLELDEYPNFNDGLPTAFLGFEDTDKDITKHPISGTPSPGDVPKVNDLGNGFEWGEAGVNYQVADLADLAASSFPIGTLVTVQHPINAVYRIEDSPLLNYNGGVADGLFVITTITGTAIKQSPHYDYQGNLTNVLTDTTLNNQRFRAYTDFIYANGDTEILFTLDTIKVELASQEPIRLQENQILSLIGKTTKTVIDFYPKYLVSDVTAVTQYPFIAQYTDEVSIFGKSEQLILDNFHFIGADSINRDIYPLQYGVLSLQSGGFDVKMSNITDEGELMRTVYFGGSNADNFKRVIRITDSELSAYVDDPNRKSVIIQGLGGRANCYLYLDRVKLIGASSHQLYIPPWLNYDINNCELGYNYTSTDRLLQANQTLPANVDSVYFQRVRNTIFVNTTGDVFNHDRNADWLPIPELTNCTFYTNGTAVDCPKVKVTNCHFENASTIRLNASESQDYLISGNTGSYKVTNTGGSAEKDVNIIITGGYTGGAIANAFGSSQSTTDPNTSVSYNISDLTINSTAYPFYTGSDSQASAGATYNLDNIEIYDNFFQGRSGNYQIYLHDSRLKRLDSRFFLQTNGNRTGVGRVKIERLKIDLKSGSNRLGYFPITFFEDRDDDYSIGDKPRLEWHFDERKWPVTITAQSGTEIDSINLGFNHYVVDGLDSLKTVVPYAEATGIGVISQDSTNDRSLFKYAAGSIFIETLTAGSIKPGGTINTDIEVPYQQGDVIELIFRRDGQARWQDFTEFFDYKIISKSNTQMANLPTYADDSAAATGGLSTGDVYKTATGELRIKL